MPPDSRIYASQHQLLDDVIHGRRRADSVSALRRYFAQDASVGPLYTGRNFERFRGGDAGSSENQITPADVLALTFLSIKDGLPSLAVDVLDVHATQISGLLTDIPAGPAMHQVTWAHFATDSAAYQLWQLLCRCGGRHRW